jgi:hypothetical protein
MIGYGFAHKVAKRSMGEIGGMRVFRPETEGYGRMEGRLILGEMETPCENVLDSANN